MTPETRKALQRLILDNIQKADKATYEQINALSSLQHFEALDSASPPKRWTEGERIWRCECGAVIAHKDKTREGTERLTLQLHAITYHEIPSRVNELRGRCMKCNIRHDIPYNLREGEAESLRLPNLRNYYDWWFENVQMKKG